MSEWNRLALPEIPALSVRIDSKDSPKDIEALLQRHPWLARAAQIAALYERDQCVNSGVLRALADVCLAANEQYPQAAMDLLDSVAYLVGGSTITAEEIKILATWIPDDIRNVRTSIKINGADTTTSFEGTLGKDSGKTVVSITGAYGTGYPLTVEVTVWADMDNPDNHHPECPMYHPEEHRADCPVMQAFRRYRQGDEPTEEEWKRADANCECGADDCYCEADVVHHALREFGKESDVNDWQEIKGFISAVIWGQSEENQVNG